MPCGSEPREAGLRQLQSDGGSLHCSSSCWAGEDSKATAPQRLITLWSLHHRAASRVAGLLRQLPRACSQRPKAEDRGSIRHFPTWSSKFCSISLTKFPMSQSLPRFKGKRYHNWCRRFIQSMKDHMISGLAAEHCEGEDWKEHRTWMVTVIQCAV